MNENNQIETVEEQINEEEVIVDEIEVVVQKKKKEKKHTKAIRLVEQAKEMVKVADEQAQACRLLLVDDLQGYDEAKTSLRHGGMDRCKILLENLGYETQSNASEEEKKVIVFEPKDEIAPIVLKNVSSGKFTGLMYGLFAGVVTAVGLVYLATEKLGVTLDLTKVPSSKESVDVLTWFSTAIGLEPNVYVGAGVLGVASLGVMALIYTMRVGLRSSKNLHLALKQLEDAELYTNAKGNCKAEMDKVDAHMKDAVTTLKMYEVLFNEQKGKLERILHIEGTKGKSTDYHEKSYAEIRETKSLIREIEAFTALPMSRDGHLCEESVNALARAKTQMDKMLERLY